MESHVELSGEDGRVFALTTSGLSERTFAARAREWAAMATGSLHTGTMENGAPVTASNGTRLRATCGVTFISPSYAVTAAHCVDEAAGDLSTLFVEMYRPTPALTEGYRTATVLGGTFPNYTHGRLGAEQGYFVDRYNCTLAARCGDAFGAPMECDAAVSAEADVAVVHCEGSPGDKYGYLDIAATDDPNAELFMPWKHEVYDVEVYAPETTDEVDQFTHYVSLSGGQVENYHYQGEDEAGVEQNQLLPLMSVPFADGTPRHKLPAESAYNVFTDLWGCHGASGSGALQQNAVNMWQLLGPMRWGDQELSNYLCVHAPSIVPLPRDPMSSVISYAGLASTEHLYQQLHSEVRGDCSVVPSGEGAVEVSLRCPRDRLAGDTATEELASRLVSPTLASSLDYAGSSAIGLAGGESTNLGGFQVTAGSVYRVGLSVGCAALPCPTLQLEFAGESLPSVSPPTTVARLQPVARLVTATASGTAVLGLSAVGEGELQVSGVTVQDDSRPNTLDSRQERREAVLFELDGTIPSGSAQPGRFVGDGREGFAVELRSEERLVLAYQALAAGQTWTIDFGRDTTNTLRCGLLDAEGAVVLETDCTTPPVVLGDTAGSDARLGVFVQTTAESAPVTLDDIVVTSRDVPAGGSGGEGGAAGGNAGSSSVLDAGGTSQVGGQTSSNAGGNAGSGTSSGGSAGEATNIGGTAGDSNHSEAGEAGRAGEGGSDASEGGSPTAVGGRGDGGSSESMGGTRQAGGRGNATTGGSRNTGETEVGVGGSAGGRATGGTSTATSSGGAAGEDPAGGGEHTGQAGSNAGSAGAEASQAGVGHPLEDGHDDSGCGCRTPRGRGPGWPTALGVLLAVWTLGRRRRV